MWVIERETRYTPPDLAAVRSTLFVSTSLSLSLCGALTLSIYPVFSLSPGIPSIILVLRFTTPNLSLRLHHAGTRMFKGLFVPLRVGTTWIFFWDVIIWWRLRYFRGRRSLLFVSLNTHNKQRVPSVATVIPFTLPSLWVAWLHADRWFEFELCRCALISDMLWIYLTS